MDPNTQQPGDHVLGEQLRQDSTGRTYRAVHATSKDTVTVKVLDEKYARDPELVARFEKHASTLRRLEHPGIVQVLEHGRSAAGLCLVMENLTGELLADRLKREGKLPLEETQRIVGAVASALVAAYRLRIIHPDLRPDDIFLATSEDEPGGVVKLLDLGLAWALADQDGPARKGIDQRAGIQALGRLAYQLLSGQLPVEETVQEGGAASKRPARLSTFGVSVPAAIEGAIVKALQRKKKRRFSSMTEFARALGIDIGVPGTPPPEIEIELDADSDVQAEAVPEDYESDLSAMAARALPPPLPPSRTLPPVLPPSPEVTAEPAQAGGFAVRAGALGRTAVRSPRTVALSAAGAAAALVLGWFALRPGAPPERLAAVSTPPPARVDVAREQKPSARTGIASAPSRVDEILALNQKAVSAHEKSDFKTARALLQDADKLAVASGYADAPVRAQTQVRLGALYVHQKNLRLGRRYLARAVAINPAVRLPPGMMSPRAHKVLIATKQKARLAKSGPVKRAKGQPARRKTT